VEAERDRTGGEQRPEPLVREALDLFGEYQHICVNGGARGGMS
jgi:hypothetical protein